MIIAAAALVSVSAMAQDSIYNHNLQVTVGGGLHSMTYKPTDGKAQLGGGALLQVKYEYMFSEHWGIGIGAGFSSYQSAGLFDYKSQAGPEAIHPDNGQKYTPYVSMNSLKEVQNMISIDIPVQAIWRHQLNNKWGLEAGLGLSLNMPVWMQYNIKSGNYGLAGYFESIHGMVENLENHGFAQIEAGEKGAIQHNPINIGLQGDFGANYGLSEHASLYFGVYVDGQMMSTINPAKVEHVNGNTLKYTNVMNSVNVACAHPVELGVKLGLSFGMGEKKPTKKYAAWLAEQQRLADEEAARLAAEKAEQERLAREAAAKAEAERLAREQAEREAAAKRAAEEAAKKAEQEKQVQMANSIQGAVTFKPGSSTPIFNEAAEAALADLRLYLEQNPDKNVYLTGHTDNTGSAEGNMRWGQKRADAYKAALVKRNIPAERVFTDSKGQTEPIADNSTEEGRAMNRRVDMVIR